MGTGPVWVLWSKTFAVATTHHSFIQAICSRQVLSNTMHFTYLPGNCSFRFNNSSVNLMGACRHGSINLLYWWVCNKTKAPGPLAVGIPHDLKEEALVIPSVMHNSHAFDSYKNIEGKTELNDNVLIFFLFFFQWTPLTTQSVRLPHCSKWARRLSSVVSKLKPPMNSLRSCSGSRGTCTMEKRH